MKHNDLSNRQGAVFGVRCDDFLIKYKEEGLFNHIANFIVSKELRAEIDEQVLYFLNYIFRETEYTVDLIVSEDKYTEKLKDILEQLPFSRVYVAKKPTQISSRLLCGELTYYVDDSAERRSLINSSSAITLDEAFHLIGKKVR